MHMHKMLVWLLLFVTFPSSVLADAIIFSPPQSTGQPLDSDLTYLAGVTPSANVKSIWSAADYATIRTLIGLELDVDIYSLASANLAFEPIGVSVADLTDTTVTAAEVTATSDGDTAATAITLADADRLVVNDNGTMLQVALTTLQAYIKSVIGSILDNISITFTGGTWDFSNVTMTIPSNATLAISGTLNGLTNDFTITTAEGTDDTSVGAAFLTDSGETWGTNTYVGMTLYNVTDVSSCVVTANTDTTMTCTLTGGTDNHWDSGNVWAVAPGPLQSGSIFYVNAATTILHPATAKYMACYYSDGANVVKVDPQSASMEIFLNGATIAAGDEIDSPGAAGDFICIQNRSTTKATTLGRSGTWIDGGAS